MRRQRIRLSVVGDGNVGIFERVIETMAQGDVEGLLALTHPECEMHPLRARVEGGYRGHDGIRQFMADTGASFEIFDPSFPEVRALAADRVLAIGSLRIRGAGSGIETTVTSAGIASFRDGLMSGWVDFGDVAAARAAATGAG